MGKGSRRRPGSLKKWSENFPRAFGKVECSRCGAIFPKHQAKPLKGGRGEVGVLCPDCRKASS